MPLMSLVHHLLLSGMSACCSNAHRARHHLYSWHRRPEARPCNLPSTAETGMIPHNKVKQQDEILRTS